MLKIALSGCNGRMGRVITDIVSGREGMEIVAGFDIIRRKTALSRFLPIRLSSRAIAMSSLIFPMPPAPSICLTTAKSTISRL